MKPQLAKSSNDCAVSVFNKPMYCSRKIDGVRSLLKDSDSGLTSVSRGGKDYDPALQHLLENPRLIEFFEQNPDIILDGEIYYHGWPLQKISGTARLKTWEERCGKLEYWIFDIADIDKTFEERLEILEEVKEFFKDEKQIVVLEHIKVEGWSSYKKLHDKFVSEGFEGLVARKPDKKYSAGKRNSDWIKLKEYQDDEFEIIGISEGLRPEDMCFVLLAPNSKKFEAKPIGPRELKYEYLDNWPILVGKKATVKFFDYSTDGIPMQPVLKSIREEDE